MKWQCAIIGASLIGVAVLPSVAMAQDPVTPAEAARAADDNRMICKREKSTGTRFETKMCKTRQQWDAIREQHMRDAKEFIDRPTIETRRGG